MSDFVKVWSIVSEAFIIISFLLRTNEGLALSISSDVLI